MSDRRLDIEHKMNDTILTFLRGNSDNNLGIGIKRMSVRTHLACDLRDHDIRLLVDFLNTNYPDMMDAAAEKRGIERAREAVLAVEWIPVRDEKTEIEMKYVSVEDIRDAIDTLTEAPETEGGE